MEKVIVVGRSNVGKSSLIEAITGVKVDKGKRPGLTLRFNEYKHGNLIFVDFPGFGFMQNVKKDRQEALKDSIVQYVESGEFSHAIEVIDAKAFLNIYERWIDVQIPVDIEFYRFLSEFTEPILAVNRIDKMRSYERDGMLNDIALKFGLAVPWERNKHFIPFSAKTRENVDALKRLLFQ
ncbi:MAG: GTP-binding protein EngB [Euryarchaeota archaeon]|nr:GTP-binding protein EngB [Euryarchaeota archaeon]